MPFEERHRSLWLVIRWRSSVVPFGASSAVQRDRSDAAQATAFGPTIGTDRPGVWSADSAGGTEMPVRMAVWC